MQCVRPTSSASLHRIGQSNLSPFDAYHRNELHSSSARGALTRFVEPVALPIRLPRALAHGAEIMFGVLEGILRLDLIAG